MSERSCGVMSSILRWSSPNGRAGFSSFAQTEGFRILRPSAAVVAIANCLRIMMWYVNSATPPPEAAESNDLGSGFWGT
jgi:hypothetical protein